jgi:hypothetical protein
VFAGQHAELMITVDTADEIKTDGILAELSGSQGWQIGSGKSQTGVTVPYPDKLGFALQRGEAVLEAGSRTEFRIAFDVPALTPPTHHFMPAFATFELFVHISIPWRIDVRQRFTIDVHRSAPADIPRLAFAVRSNSQNAAADAPRIEMGLPSRQFCAGEVLSGTVAVYHVDDDKDQTVDLSLTPLIDLYGSLRRTGIPSRGYTMSLQIPKGVSGRSVPFAMAIPKAITPTFETITHGLRWALTANLERGFMRKDLAVEAPLLIHDASGAATARPLEAAPRLGDERMARMFAKYASEHGWRGADPNAVDSDGDGTSEEIPGQFAIEQQLDDATLRIAYDYRGEHGTFLMAGIRHPALGLGLHVTPSGTMRHLMWRDIEVGISGWDRQHYVAARDEKQASPFLTQVVPSLVEADRVGTLHHWNDHGIWWEQPLPKLDEDLLANVAVQLGVVAQRIAQAMGQIKPPTDIVADMPGLTELAQRYKAYLCPGDLSLWSSPAGDPVHTQLVRDAEGQAVNVTFSFGSEALASEALLEKKIELPHLGDVLGRDMPTELIEVMTGCKQHISQFSIDRGVARCTLALAPGAHLDATMVREVVDTLRASLAAVVPSSGPYR